MYEDNDDNASGSANFLEIRTMANWALENYIREASRIADELGISNNSIGRDDRDAIRHSYTSGKMAENYGEAVSRALGELYERALPNDFISLINAT
ncbi:MAG: hypothetical protein R3E60_01200 [Alphaproteobacteria bacterium]